MRPIKSVGTQYFDDNWFLSGAGERKLTHVMDFIDSAIYLKEKGLTQKIGVYGTQESGSITTLAAAFTEPLLFDAAVIHVIPYSCNSIEPNRRFNTTPVLRYRAA